MPQTKKARLRIYCICGQKMKVSEDMYGLPGKCIACRQKIRLPRLDEIPEGTKEVYLKDHPHLLRKSKRPQDLEKETSEGQQALAAAKPLKKQPSKGEDTPITELDIDEVGEQRHVSQSVSIPLDFLEPLSRVTSIQRKLNRKLEVLRKYKNSDKTLKAEIKGQLAQVREVRDELDEQLRQLLMETAIELTSAQEKISQTQVTARVGEIPFQQYQDTVYRLRSRRDQLERRQLNLRGWLATTDPFTAGNYVDLSIEDLPQNGQRITLPPEPGDDETLLKSHSRGLREALERRSLAEHQLEEVKRMTASSPDEDVAIEEAQEEAQAKRRQAKARASFYQNRLKQLKQDLNSDLETIESQLDAARDRLSINNLDRAGFDRIDQELKQAKTDIMKALNVADRALTANSSQDVPQPQGTFLERLGFNGTKGAEPALLMTWAAALCLGLALFLPTISNLSLMQAFIEFENVGSKAAWLILLPILGGIGIALTSMLPNPVMRGVTQIGCLTVFVLLTAYFVHEAFYSLDPMAARFRSGTAWAFRPGFFLAYMAVVLVGTAAFISLRNNSFARLVSVAIIVSMVCAIGFLFTDGFGTLRPAPHIELSPGAMNVDLQEQRVSIWIENRGNRELYLVNHRSDARNSYVYSVDRQIGANSWSEVPPLSETDGMGSSSQVNAVPAGDRLALNFVLKPDEYRVQLVAGASGEVISMPFTIEMPTALTQTPPSQEPDTVSDSNENASPIPSSPPQTDAASDDDTDLTEPLLPDTISTPVNNDKLEDTVELKGIMTSPDGNLRFSLELTETDGSESRLMLSLGEELWQGWVITEFNPTRRTITIEKDDRLLILRRGDPFPLN